MKYKVNKNDFFERVAKRSGTNIKAVKQIYEAIVDEITSIVCEGDNLSLTGFGTFSLKTHAGHPVQFKSDLKNVDAYSVLKFTASDVLMMKIRNQVDSDMDSNIAKDN